MFPALALGAAALLVSACSAAPQGTATGLPSTGASAKSAGTRSGYFPAIARIAFHNNWDKVTVKTFYSYPILPTWHLAQEQCVYAGTDWKTSIGFKYPDGQVRIVVLNDGCTHPRPSDPRGRLDFKNIQYTHDPEEATIASNIEPSNFSIKFCGHQDHPIKGNHECVYISQLAQKH